ncbi:Peptidoglycan glycosyltransferase MrdB [Paenibacillus allorhizoplanae]|uniref:Peptidoglycan glycosyltransferase MrdB n=1 Tax=Paenibacillus allorhizoplanae TaxID=2905648 RepID=A0ABM9CME6_9BACL|nr:FtsW/RodA/SpoVE family cell cycle protein [Paenibacillus allorhizoplanae]CAH1217012.1 Peptidoglycan glycosyltransferase MrdB [Paenibacillus allorhizoplanae]
MSSFRQHEEITTFLKQVCREIKAKEVHSEVRLELESHLQELIEEKLSSGFDLDAAVKESISQMGTPDVIGQQFHLAHRPRFNWGLLAVVVTLMGIGLVAIFSAQAANYRQNFTSLAMKQVMFFSIGSCLMLLIGFSNYRKLAGYSWGLYIGTITLLSYVLLSGEMMNGIRGYVRFGLIQLNIPALSPYLLLIALAGIWSKPQRTMSNESSLRAFIRKCWINVGTVWLPSTLLLFTHAINNFVLFFIGCLTLLLVLRKKRAILAVHCGLVAAAFGLFVLQLSYQADRLYAFLHPNQDPLGMNYVLTQSKLAIQSAGWWGYGFGAPLSRLPALQSEMMFPFLIYCFGWGAGIALVMMIALFVQQTVNVSRKVKDPYGKAIVSALLAVFTTQFTWSMLMSIGLAPYSTFQLPFISYSGLLAILQFVSIGLMLSVYRRKDLGTYQMT